MSQEILPSGVPLVRPQKKAPRKTSWQLAKPAEKPAAEKVQPAWVRLANPRRTFVIEGGVLFEPKRSKRSVVFALGCEIQQDGRGRKLTRLSFQCVVPGTSESFYEKVRVWFRERTILVATGSIGYDPRRFKAIFFVEEIAESENVALIGDVEAILERELRVG